MGKRLVVNGKRRKEGVNRPGKRENGRKTLEEQPSEKKGNEKEEKEGRGWEARSG